MFGINAPHHARIGGIGSNTRNQLAGKWQCVRVVKESDSKSDGLCPRGFESPRCRFYVLTLKKRAFDPTPARVPTPLQSAPGRQRALIAQLVRAYG
jgi:hypothetical protein